MSVVNKYFSEYGQDRYLDEHVFNRKENGVFIEIGAADGVRLSNTFFFEISRNWSGLCVEPRKSQFEKLKVNRKCICENVCISMSEDMESFMEFTGNWLPMLSGIERNFQKEHRAKIVEGMAQEQHSHQMHVTEIYSVKLQTLLDKHNIFYIDYCSIDTEGSEMEVLQSINFDRTNIQVFTIENNYHDPAINKFMYSKGYELVKEIGPLHISLDQVYRKVL